MKCSEHFVFGKLCEFSCNYLFGWFFFLSSVAISVIIIMLNPTSIHYDRIGNAVKLLFIIAISFVGAFIGRCICYKPPEDNDELSNTETNLLKFREAEHKYGVV